MAPEGVELLQPLQRARGHVFKLPTRDIVKVSKTISSIGKAAGVVVDSLSGKFASAHDLRRAFGFRWSRKVMPAVLKEIMRHASVETTMTFYVGQNAEATAAELWKVSGNILGNNGQFEPPCSTPESNEKHYTVSTSARSSAG